MPFQIASKDVTSHSAWIQQRSPGNMIPPTAAQLQNITTAFDLQDGEIESLQYLEYGPFQFYNQHVDNGSDNVAARKYSVSIQLSDENDYVGGNLTIRGEGQSRYAPRGRGSIAVFPSHLLHQAKPVWYCSLAWPL